MAKIRNAKVKTSSGGYKRLFDDEELGLFISKLQSTVISNGTELEKMIVKRSKIIKKLDDFLIVEHGDGVYLCTKKVIKESLYALPKHEPDLVIFEYKGIHRRCYIIELKDGDSFDTKKSYSELNSLQLYRNHLGAKISFITDYYICCFNQSSHKAIIKGFKNVFKEDETMTGEELCRLLQIDYNSIIKTREADAQDNLCYFVSEIIKIPSFFNKCRELSKENIKEKDFYD